MNAFCSTPVWTEIYGTSVLDDFSPDSISRYLSEFRNIDREFLTRHSYQRTGEQVVQHLFEAASGIDSQMVGETEILGQVKKAYDDACKRKVSGKYLTDFSKRISGCKMG